MRRVVRRVMKSAFSSAFDMKKLCSRRMFGRYSNSYSSRRLIRLLFAKILSDPCQINLNRGSWKPDNVFSCYYNKLNALFHHIYLATICLKNFSGTSVASKNRPYFWPTRLKYNLNILEKVILKNHAKLNP